jgi:hypothetical protein
MDHQQQAAALLQDELNSHILSTFESRFGATRKTSPTSETLDQTIENLKSKVISVRVADSLIFALKSTDNPAVRREIVYHGMEWLAKQLSAILPNVTANTLPQDAFALVVVRLVMLGLSDVWSAIRKGCASRLAVFVPCLDRAYQEDLFCAVVTLAVPTVSLVSCAGTAPLELTSDESGLPPFLISFLILVLILVSVFNSSIGYI